MTTRGSGYRRSQVKAAGFTVVVAAFRYNQLLREVSSISRRPMAVSIRARRFWSNSRISKGPLVSSVSPTMGHDRVCCEKKPPRVLVGPHVSALVSTTLSLSLSLSEFITVWGQVHRTRNERVSPTLATSVLMWRGPSRERERERERERDAGGRPRGHASLSARSHRVFCVSRRELERFKRAKEYFCMDHLTQSWRKHHETWRSGTESAKRERERPPTEILKVDGSKKRMRRGLAASEHSRSLPNRTGNTRGTSCRGQAMAWTS